MPWKHTRHTRRAQAFRQRADVRRSTVLRPTARALAEPVVVVDMPPYTGNWRVRARYPSGDCRLIGWAATRESAAALANVDGCLSFWIEGDEVAGRNTSGGRHG